MQEPSCFLSGSGPVGSGIAIPLFRLPELRGVAFFFTEYAPANMAAGKRPQFPRYFNAPPVSGREIIVDEKARPLPSTHLRPIAPRSSWFLIWADGEGRGERISTSLERKFRCGKEPHPIARNASALNVPADLLKILPESIFLVNIGIQSNQCAVLPVSVEPSAGIQYTGVCFGL